MLATVLGHHLTTKSTLARALSIYDFIRRPAANEVAQRSHTNGDLFGLQLPNANIELPGDIFSDVYYKHDSMLGLSQDFLSSCAPIDFTQPVDLNDVVDFTKPENQSRLCENGAAIRENWRWAWETTLDGDVERAVLELERQTDGEAISTVVSKPKARL